MQSTQDGFECYDRNFSKWAYNLQKIALSGDARVWGDEYELYVGYVPVNGQKRLMTDYVYDGRYFVLGDALDASDIYKINYSYTTEAINGTFEIIEPMVKVRYYYVKLLGNFYSLENYLESRIENPLTETEYDYFYGVEENGTMRYYLSLDWETGELRYPLTSATPSYTSSTITLGDGRTIMEYYGSYAIPYVAYPQADGTVYYEKATDAEYSYGDGYLYCKDGYYVSAYRITYVDEFVTETEIIVEGAMWPADAPNGALDTMLDRYMTITDDSVTIDKQILKLIAGDEQQRFKISIGGNAYSLTLDYADLTGWFEIAQNQNAQSKYYEWNNGEYVPAT